VTRWWGDVWHIEVAFDRNGRAAGRYLYRRTDIPPQPGLLDRIRGLLPW
jgi:hypothetical protein